MHRALLGLVSALALAASGVAANAAPGVTQVPEPGVAAGGPKLPAIDTGEVKDLSGAGAESASGVTPQSTFANGCINFSGQKRTYTLSARGRITYKVVPSIFFDVTMKVNYVNIRSFFVDNFFAGGTEKITIQGPNSFRTVKVTIAGFHGSTGCFHFTSNP
jgi:hypothetical protein